MSLPATGTGVRKTANRLKAILITNNHIISQRLPGRCEVPQALFELPTQQPYSHRSLQLILPFDHCKLNEYNQPVNMKFIPLSCLNDDYTESAVERCTQTQFDVSILIFFFP